MKYFILGRESDPAIVGVTDGIGQIDYNAIDKNLANQWYSKMFEIGVKREPGEWVRNTTNHILYAQKPLVGLKLRKKGILTDYMTFDLGRILVSDKLKNVLERFNLPNHKFLPIELELPHQGSKAEYWWFAFDEDDGIKSINYAASSYEEEMTIRSYEDFEAVYAQRGVHNDLTKIVLNLGFAVDIDFWACIQAGINPYISERLALAMQAENITGCRYGPNIERKYVRTEIVFPNA